MNIKTRLQSSGIWSSVRSAQGTNILEVDASNFQGGVQQLHISQDNIHKRSAAPHPVTLTVTYIYKSLDTMPPLPPPISQGHCMDLLMHTDTKSGHPLNRCLYNFSSRLIWLINHTVSIYLKASFPSYFHYKF